MKGKKGMTVIGQLVGLAIALVMISAAAWVVTNKTKVFSSITEFSGLRTNNH